MRGRLLLTVDCKFSYEFQSMEERIDRREGNKRIALMKHQMTPFFLLALILPGDSYSDMILWLAHTWEYSSCIMKAEAKKYSHYVFSLWQIGCYLYKCNNCYSGRSDDPRAGYLWEGDHTKACNTACAKWATGES